jgi:predicted CXXCH cytochrome family protein
MFRWALAPFFALAVGCAGREAPRSSEGGRARGVESNVLRTDYAGSKACADCHPREYAAWSGSPMHRMTRSLAETSVHAPFDGRPFDLAGDTAWMANEGGVRFLHLRNAKGEELYRVTKVIGGRYREDFVGEKVSPEAPLGKALDEERVLPLSWLIGRAELRYKGYSVMVREREGLEAGLVWKRACIFCHNTTPALTVLYDELYGEGAPSYQGSASNELPAERAFRYRIDDASGLRAALMGEVRVLGSTAELPEGEKPALAATSELTHDAFDARHLVELGVGCEACHGGSLEHARAPHERLPTFALASDFMSVESPRGGAPTAAEDVNRTCAKCHTVLFSRYPYTWEGRERRQANPGGSTTNSGEARDFLLGGCAVELTCTRCHDPHGEDSREHLDALVGPRGNELCSSCHDKYRGERAASEHSHHPAGSSGSFCLNCHMPKKNMGLDYALVRYHRIGSPTDRERVEGDRPLECALCHADRSVDQIVKTMERFWGKRYYRAALLPLNEA